MTDTLFADVSEFQIDVNDKYPYHFFSFRSNDGTYRDHHFAYNLAWAKHACDTGRLSGFLVYFVWETNWQQTVATFKAVVGKPHPKMAVMIDAETWGGKISGNQSTGLNAAREDLIKWVGGYMSLRARVLRKPRKRVIGYANAGDFHSMWPTRGDTKVVLANYSANPAFPGKIAHQFSDNYACPPFGHCDMNSADGYSPAQFAAVLGLDPTPVPVPPATPSTPNPTPASMEDDMFVQFPDDTSNGTTSQHAVYAYSGGALLWLTAADYAAVGKPVPHQIKPHTASHIYRAAIAAGTPDPRVKGAVA